MTAVHFGTQGPHTAEVARSPFMYCCVEAGGCPIRAKCESCDSARLLMSFFIVVARL